MTILMNVTWSLEPGMVRGAAAAALVEGGDYKSSGRHWF